MPRDGAIIFSDLVGKLCDRKCIANVFERRDHPWNLFSQTSTSGR